MKSCNLFGSKQIGVGSEGLGGRKEERFWPICLEGVGVGTENLTQPSPNHPNGGVLLAFWWPYGCRKVYRAGRTWAKGVAEKSALYRPPSPQPRGLLGAVSMAGALAQECPQARLVICKAVRPQRRLGGTRCSQSFLVWASLPTPAPFASQDGNFGGSSRNWSLA